VDQPGNPQIGADERQALLRDVVDVAGMCHLLQSNRHGFRNRLKCHLFQSIILSTKKVIALSLFAVNDIDYDFHLL
jgi:hypothetical protein